jgi:hypothetical protein
MIGHNVDCAAALSAGSRYLHVLILGLTPQALCCRPLRGLGLFKSELGLWLHLVRTLQLFVRAGDGGQDINKTGHVFVLRRGQWLSVLASTSVTHVRLLSDSCLRAIPEKTDA